MREIVYLNRDNTIDRQLLADGSVLTALQMQAINRIDLIYNGQTFSSDDHPSVFDWTSRAAEGAVVISAGALPIQIGTDLNADLIIYDPSNPNGIRWCSFSLKVV